MQGVLLRRHARSAGLPLLPALVLTALLLRIALIFLFNTWHISPQLDHWAFGFETGRVAQSLAEGRGFSSPFVEPTGPTAWLAPGYPWLLSLIFRLFGVYSPAAALAALILNAFIAGVTCIVVYLSGQAFFDRTTGLLAAALFALDPSSIWHSINTIWDVSASALLLCAVVYALRCLQNTPGIRQALAASLAAGVLALFNPACLVVYAAGAAWICGRQRGSWRSCTRQAAVLAGIPLVLCLPWMLRNQFVMHRLTLKSNFGTELRIGNNPLAPASSGAQVMDLHPTYSEFAQYRDLGETGYVDWCMQQAVDFIRHNPAAFLKLIARRILLFWTGWDDNGWTGNIKTGTNLSPLKRIAACGWGVAALLGLALGFRYPDRMLLLITMAAYPLPFYLTHCTNRYRMPLEPVMALLAAHLVIRAWKSFVPVAPVAHSKGTART